MALAIGAVLVLAANFAVAKRLAGTPGGFALSFGRMLQDGVVKKYLDDRCPDPKLRLCAHKDQLPEDTDVWFWGSALFDKLGRFAGLDVEMQTIAVDSSIKYPAWQAQTAGVTTIRKLIAVHTGESLTTSGIPIASLSSSSSRRCHRGLAFYQPPWITRRHRLSFDQRPWKS
jgi:hypothetical protein